MNLTLEPEHGQTFSFASLFTLCSSLKFIHVMKVLQAPMLEIMFKNAVSLFILSMK